MARERSQPGFTLIEIVLVLAIAGLILIVVFLAVSGAQKTRRDYTRKQDAAALAAAVLAWRANNLDANLDSQTDLDDVNTNYLKRVDPKSGTSYSVRFYGASTPHASVPLPPAGRLTYVTEHICGSDVGTTTLVTDDVNWIHGIRQFAVIVTLESGGTYCVDNH